MPIYRGSQKVTPMRGGVKPKKVYRGSSLVYTGAAPRYSFTGADSGIGNIARNTWVTLSTHTVAAGGPYVSTVNGYVRWGNPDPYQTYQIRLLKNGVVVHTESGWGDIFGEKFTAYEVVDTPINSGDVLTFQAYTSHSVASRRNINMATFRGT